MVKDLGDGRIYCYHIEEICPYECDCTDCEVYQANNTYEYLCGMARELSVLLQNEAEQDRYDDYHADDYKRSIEDRMILED